MNHYNILNIDQVDHDKWTSLVNDHPNGSVFHLPGFYYANKNARSYTSFFLGIENQNKKLLGILIVIIKENYFYPISSLTRRADIFDGPLVKDYDISVLSALLNKYNSFAESKNIIYTLIRNSVVQELSLKNIYTKNNFLYQAHLNILIDLSPGQDILWKTIKRNRKDGINKGSKQGFVFKEIDEIDTDIFHNLVRETYKNTAIPIPPKSLYSALNRKMSENIKWFGLYFNNSLIICLLALVFNGVFSAYVIGIKKDAKLLQLRPVDFFYWEVIKWAVNNDYKLFNWLGAGKPDKEYGVRKFKLQYGGDLIEPGRYIKIHKPRIYKIMEFLFEKKSNLRKKVK